MKEQKPKYDAIGIDKKQKGTFIMKKLLAIFLTVCMLASVLCVPTLAADDTPAADVVLRISAIKNGNPVKIEDGDYKDFEEGWNEAMSLANKGSYDRVVVDLYADWESDQFGRFTNDWINGAGFKWDTIYFNDDARMTLNMNGHTIDRRFTSSYENGEVMYIDDDADVIINNGTITGGNSYNGAGGIHVIDDAKLTLNNVHIIGNVTDDWDGGGIALDGANLIMNGGSLQNNVAVGDYDLMKSYGCAVYVNDGTATFNGVAFKNNVANDKHYYGAAIYADDSTVTVNECVIEGNGVENTTSIIHAIDSSITIKKTSITGNGDMRYEGNQQSGYKNVSSLIYLDDSTLVMENGNSVTQNRTGHLIRALGGSEFYISDTTFTDNSSIVLNSDFHINDSYFQNCTFNNNNVDGQFPFATHTFMTNNIISFYNCNMGNSTYSNLDLITLVNDDLESGVVLTVSALKTDGTTEKLGEYRSFEEGWNAAMKLSNDGYWMRIENLYQAIVVDLHTDWIATNGRFTQTFINGAGFEHDTLYIPEDASLIINMNGYKIDRGLTDNISDGAVIYIMPNAEVTINDGTITGGYSDNSAGGIHVDSGVQLTLNDVHVDGNRVEDDDGSAIVLDGATLTMNGGSISNNEMRCSFMSFISPYGSLYINDATAYLKDVEFINNAFSGNGSAYGVAIYGEESTLIAENCTFKGNGNKKQVYQGATPNSVIYVDDSSMEFTNCVFEENGTPDTVNGPRVIQLWSGTVKINTSVFRNNICDSVIFAIDGILQVSDSEFEGNIRSVFAGEVDEESFFKNCTFSGNTTNTNYKTFNFDDDNKLNFENCDFGDSTFNDRSLATFDGKTVGSIFGEGSLTMIVALLALIASCISIFLIVDMKKKLVPATANNTEETETETEDEE